MSRALHVHMIVELAHPLKSTNLTTTHTQFDQVFVNKTFKAVSQEPVLIDRMQTVLN